VKSVPDVFADALVPGTPSFPGCRLSLTQPDPSAGDGQEAFDHSGAFVPLFSAVRRRESGLVCYCDLDDRVMQWARPNARLD
jgi:hypothetical protein